MYTYQRLIQLAQECIVEANNHRGDTRPMAHGPSLHGRSQ